MNSYPHEFLAHPQPLMFVAGLTPSATAGPSSRRGSVNLGTLLDPVYARSRSNSAAANGPAVNATMTTPVVSPSPAAAAVLPSVSPPGDSPTLSGSDPTSGPSSISIPSDAALSERDQEFQNLVKDLRGAIATMSGKGKVWLPERERRNFRILLVDKGIRLPMRKVNPIPTSSQAITDPYAPLPTMHSPLSPLTVTSPLHPDGLIAPVWVRKHAELVPAVFVLFLRLYEAAPPAAGSEGLTAEEARDKEATDRAKEKEKDDQLVKEIGERRRRLGERGIKLTVVLMASAATLDSPSLDPRLSYLRRASALSSKASLFVLTPVPASQLPDFVQSLQDALYDSAMEYYAAHAKRVRRKRARLPVNPLGSGMLSAVSAGSRALGSQGWAVRYDWKMGWFAEIRGEYDVARRHYEDCWNELAKMFSSTTTLPPRTKRWAEAKVLADCVAVNICKLLLYESDSSKVLGPFFVHLKKFGDLSRGWGIGEETFEFWSWVARQYRIFGELLEMGIQSGLQIPSPPSPTFPTAITAATAQPPPAEYYTTPTSSGNPLHVLHRPGFYYYTAACCSIQRQKRFEEALEVERDALASESGSASGYVSTAPGFANEKKVDHAALVIELFTKAYSLFKEQEYSQTRVALYVAFRIAETYCDSNQHDMAMRFFDRISQSFKREKWQPIVKEIRGLWYTCAQRTGNVETAAKILVEMLGPDSGVEGDERAGLQDDLVLLLKTTSPSSTEPLVINVEPEGALLQVNSGFWQSSAVVASNVPFQITLTCPKSVDISAITFSELRIGFSDERPDVVITSLASTESVDVAFLNIGVVGIQSETTGIEGRLCWREGQALVIQGTIAGESETEIQISSLKLSLVQGSWNLQLVFVPQDLQEWKTGQKSFAPVHELSSVLQFIPKPHSVSVVIKDPETAYVNEPLAVMVEISNNDERELEMEISVFLQPGEEDDTSTIALDEQESRTLITNVSLGLVPPHTTITKTIWVNSHQPVEKIIDLSIVSNVTGAKSSATVSDLPAQVDLNEIEGRGEEINRTVIVPVIAPFSCSSNVSCRPGHGSRGKDLGVKQDGEVQIGEAVVCTVLRAEGTRKVEIASIELQSEISDECRLLHSSLDQPGDLFPIVWDTGNMFSIMSQFALLAGRRRSIVVPTSGPPAELIVKWRSLFENASDSASSSQLITTILPLPYLSLPLPLDSFITAHLHPPPSIGSSEPFRLYLEIINTHPTNPAKDLTLQTDTSENFVWTGNRVSRIPVVPPNGGRIVVNIEGMAINGTGWLPLMGVRIWEVVPPGLGGESVEGRREIKVVDGREGRGGLSDVEVRNVKGPGSGIYVLVRP